MGQETHSLQTSSQTSTQILYKLDFMGSEFILKIPDSLRNDSIFMTSLYDAKKELDNAGEVKKELEQKIKELEDRIKEKNEEFDYLRTLASNMAKYLLNNSIILIF